MTNVVEHAKSFIDLLNKIVQIMPELRVLIIKLTFNSMIESVKESIMKVKTWFCYHGAVPKFLAAGETISKYCEHVDYTNLLKVLTECSKDIAAKARFTATLRYHLYKPRTTTPQVSHAYQAPISSLLMSYEPTEPELQEDSFETLDGFLLANDGFNFASDGFSFISLAPAVAEAFPSVVPDENNPDEEFHTVDDIRYYPLTNSDFDCSICLSTGSSTFDTLL